MTVTRRSALTGIAAAGTGLAVASCAQASGGQGVSPSAIGNRFRAPLEAERPVGFDGLYLNKARAMAVLEEAGVDLMLCGQLNNIYYLTSFRPVGQLLGAACLLYTSPSPRDS